VCLYVCECVQALEHPNSVEKPFMKILRLVYTVASLGVLATFVIVIIRVGALVCVAAVAATLLLPV
jgi:hypothetical protein